MPATVTDYGSGVVMIYLNGIFDFLQIYCVFNLAQVRERLLTVYRTKQLFFARLQNTCSSGPGLYISSSFPDIRNMHTIRLRNWTFNQRSRHNNRPTVDSLRSNTLVWLWLNRYHNELEIGPVNSMWNTSLGGERTSQVLTVHVQPALWCRASDIVATETNRTKLSNAKDHSSYTLVVCDQGS